jgi:hypothetical protein
MLKMPRLKIKASDFYFLYLPMIVVVVFGVINTLYPGTDNNVLNTIFSEGMYFVIVFIGYAVILAKNSYDVNHRVVSGLEDVKSSYHSAKNDELEELKRTNIKFQELEKMIKRINITNADSFFFTRGELDPIPETIKSAKTLKYTGGKLSKIVLDPEFTNFMHDENHIVKLIFPNPNNEYVMKGFVDNILEVKAYTKESYKEEIENSIKKINNFIHSKKDIYKAEISYKYCNFVPSFGLQIIENPDIDNDRIYVELYTIQTSTNERIQFKTVKNASPTTYEMFSSQFDLLWEKSSFEAAKIPYKDPHSD